MDVRRSEIMSQREHRKKRGVSGFVAEIIAEFATCQFGARSRFGRDETRRRCALKIMPHERKCDSAEIRAAAEARYHHVGIFAGQSHLLFSLKSYHRLMQSHMVEHRAKSVFAPRSGARKLYRFRNSCAERPLMMRVGRENIFSRTRRHGRRRSHLRSESLHHTAPVRLLLVTYLHLIHRRFQAEQPCGICHRRAPLPRTGLSCHIRHALLPAIIGLRKR